MIKSVKQLLHTVVSFSALATWVNANVLVVDATGGGSFIDIQPAVDAATAGDTILIKTGTYSGFTIGDKSLNIVTDAHNTVQLVGSVHIGGTSSTTTVVLVGLQVSGDAGLDALAITSCLGSVRVERCQFVATDGVNCLAGDGANVANSPDVSFAGCTLRGAASHQALSHLDSEGLSASGSSVASYDSTMSGIQASSICDGGASECYGAFGGDGAFLEQSFLFASNGHFTGGGGGSYQSACGAIGCSMSCAGGMGGSGLILLSPSIAVLLTDTFVPGAGGSSGPGGTAGPGATIDGSGATMLAGRARMMRVQNPVRELATVPIRIFGQPGDAVYLFMSTQTSFRYVPNYNGVQIPKHPSAPTFVGMIDSTGMLVTQITFPDLGPGVDAGNEYLQAAHQDVHGQWTFGTPASLIVLDQSF